VSSASALARAGTVCWYALVALPVRPPWQRDRRPHTHSPVRRAVARLLVGGLLVLTLTGGPGTSPGTALRLLVALRTLPVTAMAVPWGLAHGGTPTVRGGLIVVSGMDGGHGARSTVTLGSVALTARSGPRLNAAYLTHERRHSEQWAVFGPVGFPVAYGAAEAAAERWFGGHGYGNVFEIAAGLLEGGYDVSYDAPAARVAARWLAPEVPRAWRCRVPGSLRRTGKAPPTVRHTGPDATTVVVVPGAGHPGAPGHARGRRRCRDGRAGWPEPNPRSRGRRRPGTARRNPCDPGLRHECAARDSNPEPTD
jgi:hypothetical protein